METWVHCQHCRSTVNTTLTLTIGKLVSSSINPSLSSAEQNNYQLRNKKQESNRIRTTFISISITMFQSHLQHRPTHTWE